MAGSRPGQPGGKRDRARQRNREALAAAALELFLLRGVEGVTIDDIVGAAAMAKGSFYRHFANKGALVDALLEPLRQRVGRAFERSEEALRVSTTPESVSAAYLVLAEELAPGVLEHPKLVLLYLQECRGPASGARLPVRRLAERITSMGIALTHVAHACGLLRPFDARVSAPAVIGAVEKILFEILTGNDVGDPLAVPEALVSLVLEGLRA